MSGKRMAMVDELSDWVKKWRNVYGRPPTQQEVDDFCYSWHGTGKAKKV